MYSNNFIALLANITDNFSLTSAILKVDERLVSTLYNYYQATDTLTSAEKLTLQDICKEEGLESRFYPSTPSKPLPVTTSELHTIHSKLLVHEYKLSPQDVTYLRKIYPKVKASNAK